MMLLQVLWKIFNNLDFSNQYISFFVGLTTFFRYIAYFTFGMSAYIYQKELLNWISKNDRVLIFCFILSLPAVIICWIAKYYWHSYHILDFVCFPLNLILYTITIAILFKKAHSLHSKDTLCKRFIMYLGNYSFGIFLIHLIYMYLGDRFLEYLHFTPENIYFYPLLFLFILSLSIFSMEVLTSVSWGHYFIGHVGNNISLHKENNG